jgi:isocitrate dehydrogenase
MSACAELKQLAAVCLDRGQWVAGSCKHAQRFCKPHRPCALLPQAQQAAEHERHLPRTGFTIGILKGDDFGHEIVPASVDIARAAAEPRGVQIVWRPLPIGARALETHGHTLPPETMQGLQALDGWILGPIGHRAYPKGPNAINPHPILRKQFNLFANVRPTRSYPDIGCLHDGVTW